MDTGACDSPSQWDRLPFNLWERILTLLPISTLASATAISRPWRSFIKSRSFFSLYRSVPHPRQDLYFVQFTSQAGAAGALAAVAYHPYDDRWVSLPLTPFSCPSSCCALRRVHASGGEHLLVEQKKGTLAIYNFFTRSLRSIAPMISIYFTPYVLALIEDGPSRCRIVAVSTVENVYSQVYDSDTGRWVMKGQFPCSFAVLGNSVYIDGILYCLSRAPDCLLAFDLSTSNWSLIDVPMPSLVCSHILEYRGWLLLVGGEEELGDVSRIGIWRLDRGEGKWKEVCYMPDGLFRRFGGNELGQFEIVDRRGVICFCKTATNCVLMCDLSERRWWRPAPSPFHIPRSKRLWLGHALEPSVEVLGLSD